jgi:chloride channel 3/4/5
MVKFNLQWMAFRRKHLVNYPVIEAVSLATLTAVIGYFNRFLRIDMTEMMSILFRECEGGGDYDNLCQYATLSISSQCLTSWGLNRTSVQWSVAASLLLATIIRVLLVMISYGCKVPAGIFVPSMAIGATFGRMIGIMVKAMNRYVGSHSWDTWMEKALKRPEFDSAYPNLGIFAVCSPDVPCITPGTYAFLGAAAALRYVVCKVSIRKT